ncbi:SHOCT domain-containing protein [Bradyrhizobium sp. 1]|uniref:SHOCT domain-containing protein n=1 Tax=Bradyrhizobium sp. 1 TaxID=241591 RepID=UPI001FFA0C42|nr:SHOCT domain-containing protein [Bradyrhizobium sp. 1]MCK1391680.1 SHOCT domain-containing protein [Bradyrhizobium sp. 1]
MQQLTDEGRRIVDDVARRHGFSSDAVLCMLLAVSAGYGNQAQFNHPEFGGMGQWSMGGMIMIGDMFNNYLKGRVDSLCQELSSLIQGQPLFQMPAQSQSQSQGGGGGWQGQSGGSHQQQSNGYGNTGYGGSGSSLFVPAASSNWWPADLGMPGSTGGQNNLRYAYFPAARRLAVDINGQVSVYDTGQHQIGGFSQQQSGDQSITFTSQFGLVRVADLPRINPVNTGAAPQQQPYASQPEPSVQPSVQPWVQPEPSVQPAPWLQPAQSAPAPMPPPPMASSPPNQFGAPQAQHDEIVALLEKLADLHKKCILTDSEFESKKAELLSRL